jgi:excisionase family DNA binding protein
MISRETSQTSSSTSSRVLDMATPDYTTWLTKPEAAARRDKSTKTIDRWTAEGKLTPVRGRRGGRGPLLNLYNPVQVDEVVSEGLPEAGAFVLTAEVDGPSNGNGHHPVRQASQALAVVEPGPIASEEIWRAVVAIAHRVVSEMSRTSSTRPILTLEEAAAESGWTKTYLLRKIHNGTLKAEKDRGWKIRRSDLEAL